MTATRDSSGAAWVFEAIHVWAYLGIFFMLVAAGFGVPIPEELPVITGGAAAGHPDTDVRWWIMLPICIAGVVISDGCLYCIGRFWGPRLLKHPWLQRRLLPPDRVGRIERNFHEYGVGILLFARVMPAIRSPIFITAGIMRVPLSRFLLADGIYAIPGVSLLFFLGYLFANQIEALKHEIERFRAAIFIVGLTLVAAYLLYRFMKKPVSTGAPEELPPIVSQIATKTEELVHKTEALVTGHGHHEKSHPPVPEEAQRDEARSN